MKKYLSKIWIVFLTFVLAVSLTACASEDSNIDPEKVNQLADQILSEYQLSGGTLFRSSSTTLGEYLDEDLIRGYYGSVTLTPDFSIVESYAVYIDESNPTAPREFGIFQIQKGADTTELLAVLSARIAQKIDNAKAYISVDTTMLETAKVSKSSNYVWYVAISADSNSMIDDALSKELK